MKRPIGLAPVAGAEEHLYRRWTSSMFFGLLLLFSQSTLTHATLDDDLKDLLPPVSADHSPTVAQIRKAFKARDLSSMGKKTEELIAQEPTNFEGYFWQGFLELQRRNNYDAVRFLRRAEALRANSYVLKLLAFSYYFLDQFRLFALTMKEAMLKQPADFAPYYYLGRYYVSNDATDFAGAAGYFQEALERAPNHYASYYYLGHCHEAERKLKDAELEYHRSMELAEAAGEIFALPRQGLARLRLLENRPTDALEFATQAVKLTPNDAASHEVLARVYAALGRAVQAASEWERVAALDPTNPAPYYRLYRTYSNLGNKEKADGALAKYKILVAMYGTH
jgi:tetratricopeptide (TPR) repeat protein